MKRFTGTALMLAFVSATAQTSPTPAAKKAPAQAAAAYGAPSEAARRQALSPFRFILRHADTPVKPRTPASSEEARRKPAAPAAPKEEASNESKFPPGPVVQTKPQLDASPSQIETAVAPPAAAAMVARTRAPLVPIRQDGPVLTAALQRDPPVGSVKVAFEVQANGTTSDVKIVQSTNRRLNGPALAAVQAWRFQPIEETRSLEIDFVFSDQ